MATQAVVATRTGTGFTIDVTLANLSSDLTLKDFYVLKGSPASLDANSNWQKTTQTTLTYVGASVPSNTLFEVRRSTPVTPIQTIQYAQRFSSGDFNNEIDRITRRAEEYSVFGVGPGAILTTATPLDTPFGVSWDGNIVNPPSMNSVYDYVVGLAPTVAPTFSGVVTIPTPATGDNSTTAASTAYVKNNLALYAPLASPTLTGVPAAPTATKTTNTTQLATTAFGHLASVAKKIWSYSTTAASTISTTSYVTYITSSSITPRSSASSFLILADISLFYDNTSYGQLRLRAGSTTIQDATFYASTIIIGKQMMIGVYTPGSGSAFTVTLQGKLDASAPANTNFRINDSNGLGTTTTLIQVIEFENTL